MTLFGVMVIFHLLQITDSDQELVSIWNTDPSDPNPYVGFIPNPATNVGTPKLKAFLNHGFLLQRDYGVDIRVVSVPVGTNTIKFQWKLSNEKTFRSEVTANQATGLYTTRAFAYHVRPDNKDSSFYIYFDTPTTADVLSVQAEDRYFVNITFNDGQVFVPSNPNTAHQIVECSGRGTCDRMTGQCQCSEGYTGDACQRTVCPNECSGHGICQSQRWGCLYEVPLSLMFRTSGCFVVACCVRAVRHSSRQLSIPSL